MIHVLLFAHPTLGVVGILVAMWVLVETLNASEENQYRVWLAAMALVVCLVLAWIKESYEPVNSFMGALTGHDWITHGLVVLAVFLLLGWLFTRRGVGGDGWRLVIAVTGRLFLAGPGWLDGSSCFDEGV
jgi:hypothetical protein